MRVWGLGVGVQELGLRVEGERSGSRVQHSWFECRGDMARIRPSWPDSGLGFQVKVLKPF